jgi:hypothetical protein
MLTVDLALAASAIVFLNAWMLGNFFSSPPVLVTPVITSPGRARPAPEIGP